MPQQKDLKYFLSNNFKEKYDTVNETFFINETFSNIDINNPNNREKILFSTSIGLMYQNIKENIKYEFFLKGFNGKKNFCDVIIFNDIANQNKKIENIFENKIYSNVNFNETFINDCNQIKRYLKELKEHSFLPSEKDEEFFATLVYYKPEIYFNNPSNFPNYLNNSFKITNISEIDDIINKTGFFIITWKIKCSDINSDYDLSKKTPVSYTVPFVAKFTSCYFSYVNEKETLFNARLRTPINQLNKLPYYNNEGDIEISNIRDLMNVYDKNMINERINIFKTFIQIYFRYKNSNTKKLKQECLNIDPDPRNLQLKISKTIIRKTLTEDNLCDLTINSCNCNITDGQHSSINYYKIYDDVNKAINSNEGYFKTNSIYDKAIKEEYQEYFKNINEEKINLKEFKELILDKLTVDINIRGIEDSYNAKINTNIKNTRREVSKKDKLERKYSLMLNFISNTYNISEKNINNNIIQFNKSHHSNQLLLKSDKNNTLPISYLYYIVYFSFILNKNTSKEKMLKNLNVDDKTKIIQIKEIWEKNFERDFSNDEFIDKEFLIQYFSKIKDIPEIKEEAIKNFIDTVSLTEKTIKPLSLEQKIKYEIENINDNNDYDKTSWKLILEEIKKNTQMDSFIRGKLFSIVDNINDNISQGHYTNIEKMIEKIIEIDIEKTTINVEILNVYFEFFSFLIAHYKNNISKIFSFDEESYIKLIINIMIYNNLPLNIENVEKIIDNIDFKLEKNINNSILELRDSYNIKILRSNYKDNNDKTRIELLEDIYNLSEIMIEKDKNEINKTINTENYIDIKEKITKELNTIVNDIISSGFKYLEKNLKVFINEKDKNISFVRQVNIFSNKGDLERLCVNNKINIQEYIKENYNFTVYTIEHGNGLVKPKCQNVKLVEQGIKSQSAKSYSMIES